MVVHHEEPVRDPDSGFLFFCGDQVHETSELRIVDLDRFIANDAALGDLRDSLALGQCARRTAPDQPWLIEALPPDPEEQAA